jgi:hypothetical protein
MFQKRRSNPLASTPLCQDLSARKLRTVKQFGTVLDVPLGRHLTFADYPPQAVIILTGAMVSTSGSGERILEAGTAFGTIIDPHEGCALETIADSTLFVISRREFSSLRNACPRLATRLLDSSLPPPSGSSEIFESSNRSRTESDSRSGSSPEICDGLTVPCERREEPLPKLGLVPRMCQFRASSAAREHKSARTP